MEKINIVVPMAGKGQRFFDQGYNVPKPFIDVGGKMMIERVLSNLDCKNAFYTLIMQQEHITKYENYIKNIKSRNNVRVIAIHNNTDGAACTVLASHRFINNDTPLLIANVDQIIGIDINTFLEDSFNRKLDGTILTFKANNAKWSYAKINSNNLVTEVKEKVVISDQATAGIYFFAQGKLFINAVMDMIAHADKTNNEYYICPIYNFLIKQNKRIGNYEIPAEHMHGIGIPEDLERYIKYVLKVKTS